MIIKKDGAYPALSFFYDGWIELSKVILKEKAMSLDSKNNSHNDKDLIVGRVVTSHGVKGVVKIESYSDYPERFQKGSRFFVQDKDIQLVIDTVSPDGKQGLLVKFFDVDDRDQADKLRNTILTIPKEEAAPLRRGEYYFWQLIGMEVRQNDEKIGEIKEIIPNLANDIYLMAKSGGGEVMIPALKSVVKDIDIDKGVMSVELPAGLDE